MRVITITIASIGFVGLVVLAATVWHRLQQGELGAKPAWATLQTAELDHRGEANQSSVVLIERAGGSKYTVVGLPERSRASRAWLVLSGDRSAPSPKLLPPGADFLISCSEVDSLAARTKIDASPLSLLRAKCSK